MYCRKCGWSDKWAHEIESCPKCGSHEVREPSNDFGPLGFGWAVAPGEEPCQQTWAEYYEAEWYQD